MTRGDGSAPPSLSGTVAALRDAAAARNAAGLRAYFTRQERGDPDADWDAELAADLFALLTANVGAVGESVADHLGGEFDEARTLAYLAAWSRGAAERINEKTRRALAAVGKAEDPETEAEVFAAARTTRAPAVGLDLATSSAGWATVESAKQNRAASKTWRVNASNSRHPSWDGETVEVWTQFASGGQYPGDPILGVEETAGCLCTLDVG